MLLVITVGGCVFSLSLSLSVGHIVYLAVFLDMCSEVVEPSDRPFRAEVAKVKSLSDEAKEILTTVSALNQVCVTFI